MRAVPGVEEVGEGDSGAVDGVEVTHTRFDPSAAKPSNVKANPQCAQLSEDTDAI